MEKQAQNQYENTWQCPVRGERGYLQVGGLGTGEMDRYRINKQGQIQELDPGKGAI